MTDVWSDRADAYRQSREHSEGWDLDVLVEWAEGAHTAVDVATGGGHVTRRLRERGLEVVSVDPSPGMQADVVSRAEELPFADGSFDLAVCRLAAHHFEDVGAGIREMARVARDLVLVVDNLWMGDEDEEASRLRDPSHVRNYSADEWRALFAGAGLPIENEQIGERRIEFEPWLARAGCEGQEAARVRELLADRIADGYLTVERGIFKARKR